MLKRLLNHIPFIVALMMAIGCANMKAPSGGPKDMYPPVVVESEPPNYTINFTAEKIELKFNEFVNVSDVLTEVFISPPMNEVPDIKTRGKKVIITFEEELKENSTYSIYFGKSIKDITEANPMGNYTYVFSTGDHIDSLSLIGEVIDAFNLKPREDVLVMLYEDKNDTIPFDSLPYLVKPSYLTRTNQSGFYVINNLRDGEYRLFALADNNMTAIYDQLEEEIAFIDSLITPVFMAPAVVDTAKTDSLGVQADSIFVADSVFMADSITEPQAEEGFNTLFLFKEVDTIQVMLGAEKPRKGVLRFIFRYPAEDVEITPLTPVSENWMAKEWNEGKDTLRYYILDQELDTISLKVSKDTVVFDTVSYSLKDPELQLRKKDQEKAMRLAISSNTKVPFPYIKDFVLTMGYPVKEMDTSRMMLVENTDTLVPRMESYGSVGRKLRLDREFLENTSYYLFIPDSVITDIIGRSNDSTEFRFTTDSYEDYGLYQLHVGNESPYQQLIIQLLREDETFVREDILNPDGSILWDYIPPGKYMIKAIGDINGNGRWDTGKFLDGLQPEPVVFYSEVIEIRAGWSFEEDWIVVFE